MHERNGEEEQIKDSVVEETWEVSPEIQAKMPPKGSVPFNQIGPIRLAIHDIRQVLHPDRIIPL
jgi:hypothetical protein